MLDEGNSEQTPGSKPARTFHMPPVLRKTLISILSICLICGLAGTAYVLYQDHNTAVKPIDKTAPISADPVQEIKPVQPGANVKESAAIEALSSPVKPGDEELLSVKTLPKSICKLMVTYNGAVSTDPALAPKTADEFGSITWDWFVPKTTPFGSWPAHVVCAHNDFTAVVDGTIVVSNSTGQ